jgi:hypothetical protein
MLQKINEKLAALEKAHSIKILYACESGSRAWGFASPDSDYDIRFIYKHEKDWYLNLWEQKDMIEFMTTDDLDGSGWDLAKALRLLAKSNASLLEWVNSPVQYMVDDSFLTQIRAHGHTCFSPISTMYHYLSMAKNFEEGVQQEHVKLKHLFYALRTALSGKWIADRLTVPPVAFAELLPLVDPAVETEIRSLIQIKSMQGEAYMHPKNELVTDCILDTIRYNETIAPGLPAGSKSANALNDLFISEINRPWT